MEQIRCIYCNETKNLSISDIIPDSITTAKCTNKNVCRFHNNLTNSMFEDEFSKMFSFFRNQLGFNNRRDNTKPIRYKVGFYIDKEPNVRIKPDFTKTFTSYKDFILNNFVIDKNGRAVGMNNVPPRFKDINNSKISYTHLIDYKKLFLSITTLKTVAKMGFEWHCKNNNIIKHEEKRYKRIVDYIINNKVKGRSPIEIVDDKDFIEHTLKMFSFVDGSHAFLEYLFQGRRYVLFSLFGAIWYRINICSDFTSDANLEELNQFLLDGTTKVTKSNGSAFDYNNYGITRVIENYFEYPKTTRTSKIKKEEIIKSAQRMEYITKTLIATVPEIKRIIKSLLSDKFLDKGIEYYYNLVNFKENRKIIGIILLYVINEFNYDLEKNQINNLTFWHEKVINYSSNLLTFWDENLAKEKFIGFKDKIEKGLDIFNSISRGDVV